MRKGCFHETATASLIEIVYDEHDEGKDLERFRVVVHLVSAEEWYQEVGSALLEEKDSIQREAMKRKVHQFRSPDEAKRLLGEIEGALTAALKSPSEEERKRSGLFPEEEADEAAAPIWPFSRWEAHWSG